MLIDILIRINIFGGENQAAVSKRVIPLTELRPSSNKHESGFAVKCQELNEKKSKHRRHGKTHENWIVWTLKSMIDGN